MQPGLRRLAAGPAQLTPIARRAAGTCAKSSRCSRASADQALLRAPGFDAGAGASRARPRKPPREHAAGLRVRRRVATRPAPRRASAGRCASGTAARRRPRRRSASCLARAARRAWRPAALLCLAFAEDFAIIDGATATIPWLAVCLPSRWAPEDKVGRHFAEVHAPVADNRC